MKKLIIIRHAEAVNKDHFQDDFERPLTEKGREDASSIGKCLKEKNIFPNVILSSPAIRAISTAECIAKEIGYKKEIQQNQYIYEAYVHTLQEIIEYVEDTNDTVFLIGHNPSISALAYMLGDLKEIIPTSATVEINFNVTSWVDISKENHTLISYDPLPLNT